MNSNPFCTRFVRPGAIEFQFHATCHADHGGEIVEHLLAQRFGLIVGPHGSGKSTLLQTLMPQLQRRFASVVSIQLHACPSSHSSVRGPSVHNPSGRGWPARIAHARGNAIDVHRHQRQLGAAGLLVIDGIEQLPTTSRWRLLHAAKRKGQFVLGTSHRKMRSLASLYETKVTARLIETLTESLLANSPESLSNRVMVELRQRDLTTLSDVREFWFDLYDVVETVNFNGFTTSPAK